MGTDDSAEARPTILIVEDEAIIRLVARDILEDAAFDVIEAASAQEAVEILDGREDVAAVFTDVHMPGDVDGLSLARMASQRWPNVRVAVTSGRARPEISDLPTGTVFVPKPYRPEDLVEKLQALVKGGSDS